MPVVGRSFKKEEARLQLVHIERRGVESPPRRNKGAPDHHLLALSAFLIEMSTHATVTLARTRAKFPISADGAETSAALFRV